MTELITRREIVAGIAAQTLTLVDALPASYFDQQHLPCAVNLIAEDVQERAETLLPDRDAPIAVYCTNPACPN